MGPDNLVFIHSTNTKCGYILGLEPVTESMVIKNRHSPHPQGAQRVIVDIQSYPLALSLYIFHWHNNCNRLYVYNSHASYNSMQYYKPFTNINLFTLINMNNPLRLVKVLSKWYKWGNRGMGHTAKWQNWNLIPRPSLHEGYLNLAPLTFWAW